MFPLGMDTKAFKLQLDKQIEAGRQYIESVQKRYTDQVVTPDQFGIQTGPFHAASILSWVKIAEMCSVPHVPTEVIAKIPMEDAYKCIDGLPLSTQGELAFGVADTYAKGGGFWRTDLCAGMAVKWSMSQGSELPDHIPILFDDPRLMEFNTFMSEITIVGRPRVTPQKVNNYPVEFRVFIGGSAHSHGAVSFYYPQAGTFEVTPNLKRAMNVSYHYAHRIHKKRLQLGLIPWIPERGNPDERIGCTIDFMLLEDNRVVMIDAGPGFGYGADPCCFLHVPVQGTRWQLADGVTLREG